MASPGVMAAAAAVVALALVGCGPAKAPATPTGLSAVAGNQLVTLSWIANTEEDLATYEVHQGTSSGALTKVATVAAPATSTVVAGLANGTTYFFALTATDEKGNASERSAEVQATPFQPDVIPPTLVSSVPASGAAGVAVNTAITIVFSEDMDTASVSVNLSPAVALGAPAWADPKTVTVQPAGPLAYDTSYTVTVDGRDAAGNVLAGLKSFGFATASETQPPAVPTGLSAVPGDRLVVLTWDANLETDLAGYEVYMGTTSALTRVASVVAPAITYAVSGLTNGTTYYFAIAAKDLHGNLSERTAQVSAAPFLPDASPPTVTLVVPATLINVAVNTDITLIFSEDMDQGTVTMSLTPPPPAPLSAPEWTDGRTVSFHPTAEFLHDTAYTITVAGTDLAGNPLSGTKTFTFTTVNPPDVIAPTLDATGPAEGAVGVGVATNITFEFSEPMNQATVAAAFSAVPAITCSWAVSADGRSFTCVHAAALAFATNYVVTMGVGATDLAGNPLALPTVVHFLTAALPDTVKPVVCTPMGLEPCPPTTTTAPAPGAIGVARTTNIVVRFSEPMNQASVQAAFAITAPAGHTTGLFTWNAAGNQVTFNPDVDFAYGDNVTWRVGTGASDLSGNTMAATFTSTFRVIRRATATLYSTPALDGFIVSTGAVSTADTVLVVGDNAINTYYRGFLSFDLSSVPADATRVTAATLYAYQSFVGGAPYTDLGTLRAASVSYGSSLTSADFEAPIIKTLQCPPCVPPICIICNPLLHLKDEIVTLSSTITIGTKSADVARKVWDDLENRSSRGSRSQFRVYFPTNTNAELSSDFVYLLSGEASNGGNRARLIMTYEYP